MNRRNKTNKISKNVHKNHLKKYIISSFFLQITNYFTSVLLHKEISFGLELSGPAYFTIKEWGGEYLSLTQEKKQDGTSTL